MGVGGCWKTLGNWAGGRRANDSKSLDLALTFKRTSRGPRRQHTWRAPAHKPRRRIARRLPLGTVQKNSGFLKAAARCPPQSFRARQLRKGGIFAASFVHPSRASSCSWCVACGGGAPTRVGGRRSRRHRLRGSQGAAAGGEKSRATWANLVLFGSSLRLLAGLVGAGAVFETGLGNQNKLVSCKSKNGSSR